MPFLFISENKELFLFEFILSEKEVLHIGSLLLVNDNTDLKFTQYVYI